MARPQVSGLRGGAGLATLRLAPAQETAMRQLRLPRRTLIGSALAAPFVHRATAAEGEITVAAYSGIFEDNYKPAVIEPFMKANPGIKVTYYSAGASAQTLGVLRSQKAAPQIDVVLFDVSVAKGATDDGLLEDISDLPVMKELLPNAFTKGVLGAAGTFDNYVMLYSPKNVTPAPDSWKEFWNPKHKGRMAITAPPDIVGISFTLMANKTWGGGDYRKSVETGIAKIAEIAPDVLSWAPAPDPYTFVIQGQADLAVGWNARGQLYSAKSDGRLAVAIPKEGSLFQINQMCLVKGSRNTAAARTFISYALGAEAQKSFTERMFYAPVNAHAKISAEAMAKTASTPERLAEMLDVDWLEIARIRGNILEQWRRRILNKG
jgi:putative spermidine/putrescine transport system substrate-binding protein